jgi:4-amino-4-deoxy-L-arabinose transferase-like glycosyltransferase
MTPWDRRDTRTAVAIAALALAVRVVQASFPRVVGADSPQFLLTAMDGLQAGDWTGGLRTGVHPGYPAVIALFGTIAGSLEAGAYAASALFGAMVTVPLFVIARDMVGRRAAAVAALLLACLPYYIVEHSEVMSEALFHFLYATGVALAWFGATRASPTYYALCGFVGGLAYLTRPEGVYLAAAQAGLTAMVVVASPPRPWRIVAFSLGALAIWIAVASPVLLWYRSQLGRWAITSRMSVAHVAQTFEKPAVDAPPAPPRPGWGHAVGRCLWQMGRTTMWIVLAFVVAGAALARGRIRPLGAAFLACLVFGYVGPPVMAAASGYPLSHRYVMPSVLFMLPFAGIAWAAAVELASRRWDPVRVSRVAAVALGVLATAGVVRGVHPREERLWAIPEAARWLVERGARETTTYATTHVVGVYLGKRPVRLEPDVAWLEKTFDLKPGEYAVVVENHWNADVPGWRAILERRLGMVARFPSEGADPKLARVSVWQRR